MEWISVKDKLPANNIPILFFDGKNFYVSIIKTDYNDEFWIYSDCCECVSWNEPTHWMPLPEPPKE